MGSSSDASWTRAGPRLPWSTARARSRAPRCLVRPPAIAPQQAGRYDSVPAPDQLQQPSNPYKKQEFEPHYGQPISQCELLLTRAKEGGASSVNIVPTHYWVDTSSSGGKYAAGACHPDNWAEGQHVDYYCEKWEWDSACEPFTAERVARFAKGFKDCLQKAHDLFDEVLVSPHLDDGTKTMHWRNMLMFDPLQKDAHGFTYWDVMLGPIFDAAKVVYTKPGKTLIFGLEGEMGGTVFFAPASYARVAERVRAEYRGPARLDVAVTVNHAYVAGVVNRGDDVFAALPPSAMARKDGGWGPLLPFAQWPEHARLQKALPDIQRLLASVDVIGVSCYARAGSDPKPEELESCAVKADAELAAMGFSLRKWASLPGKRFIFNEVGLGGGISECGDTPARTREEAGRFSWLGSTTTFTAAGNPWRSEAVRGYARDWWGAALRLLKRGGLRYRVDGAFLWNVVSWDVQGIHPASTSGEGSFRDDVIAGWIRQHNAEARGGR